MTLVEELRAALGRENVLLPGDDTEPYTHDETEDLRFQPDVVVRPRSAQEVSAVLRIADRERIPVTPRAAGTSLSGGALPVRGGIVLSVERMNRILEIDRRNLVAVVEPAVITQVLQEEVERVGLYYPPDPASRGSCMLGGNIAHNAGGPHALKYGVTRDWVLGLEAVLANGDIIQTGGKLLKNVTGYNLTQLLVGSEGTLAIVTKIVLKLIPKPPKRRLLLVAFPDLRTAAAAVADIFFAQIHPSCCEFMERAAMDCAERKKGMRFPLPPCEAALMIELDGKDDALLDAEMQRASEVCMTAGALDVVVADDAGKQEHVWALRRCIGEAVKSDSTYREEDCVVPRARLPELMDAIREVAGKHGLTAISYGHIGDGNVHVNILKQGMSDDEWARAIDQATRELFERTVALGGMISGEHGIGYVQRNFMPIALSPEVLRLMRDIKRVFDPNNILNPGKVFPDENA